VASSGVVSSDLGSLASSICVRFETEVAQLILYRRSLDAKLMLFLVVFGVKFPVSWNIEIGL